MESCNGSDCSARLVTDSQSAQILQVLLALTAVLIILVILLSRNRLSGVYSNPSSIATMASLLHHPRVLDDFQKLDPWATDDDIARLVSDQIYKLGCYKPHGESMKYGIIPVVGPQAVTINRGCDIAVPYLDRSLKSPTKHQGWRQNILRTLGDLILIMCSLGVLGVVVAYNQDTRADGFNQFMNSQKFGPRFVLVSAGGIIGMQWKGIERGKTAVYLAQPSHFFFSFNNIHVTRGTPKTNTFSTWQKFVPYNPIVISAATPRQLEQSFASRPPPRGSPSPFLLSMANSSLR